MCCSRGLSAGRKLFAIVRACLCNTCASRTRVLLVLSLVFKKRISVDFQKYAMTNIHIFSNIRSFVNSDQIPIPEGLSKFFKGYIYIISPILKVQTSSFTCYTPRTDRRSNLGTFTLVLRLLITFTMYSNIGIDLVNKSEQYEV